jgi:hypothetical protein
MVSAVGRLLTGLNISSSVLRSFFGSHSVHRTAQDQPYTCIMSAQAVHVRQLSSLA